MGSVHPFMRPAKMSTVSDVRSQRDSDVPCERLRSSPDRNGQTDEPPAALRVLCVDDNHDAADSEAMLLELYGCEVAVCYDGASALAEALRFSPDICLIDFNMPEMDGCTVAEHLRSWRKCDPLYLIAVTAHGSEAVRAQTTRVGFDLHLVKPVNWENLTRVLADRAQSLGRAAPISGQVVHSR